MKLGEIERLYRERTRISAKLYRQAARLTPGGVHHQAMIARWPIQRGVCPPFINEAKGQYMSDVDGNKYTDYYNHGALFLGHAHPVVVKAVQEQIARGGAMMGDFTELQIECCKQITSMVPSAKEVRFCNSGTEGTMYAIRLARAYTKTKEIGKFAGHFHGYSDQLYLALSPPYNKPSTAGVPSGCIENTVILRETMESVEKAVKQNDFAAIICEVIKGSTGGGMHMDIEFLEALREITRENGIVLIFDEVISGFRIAVGGAQEYFNVLPDLTVLGKNVTGGIGGAGAFCGGHAIMEVANPKVYEPEKTAKTGGTFSGNALNMAAGLACLKFIANANGALNRHANRLGDKAKERLNDFFEKKKVKAQAIGTGSFLHVAITDKHISIADDLLEANKQEQYKYHLWLITQGIYISPGSNFYISAVHTQNDIDALIEKTQEYFQH